MAERPDGPGESREEVVSRVQREQSEINAATASTVGDDVTSRRHLAPRALATGAATGLAAGLVGLLIGIVWFSPWIPVSFAVAGFVLGVLLTAERDDGVIAERADHELDRRGITPPREQGDRLRHEGGR